MTRNDRSSRHAHLDVVVCLDAQIESIVAVRGKKYEKRLLAKDDTATWKHASAVCRTRCRGVHVVLA